MKYNYFRFENFKGIKSQILDFSKNPNSKVFTLVGLNESGKTTILEAINYFKYNPESLDALDLYNYRIGDIHDLIPIDKRDNFNGHIVIEAGIELDESDIIAIKKALKEEIDIELTNYSHHVKYTQKYYFENSKHIPKENKLFWEYEFHGKTGKQRKEKKLEHEQASIANKIIKTRIPSILYFPNFLFEFPDKIYLNSNSKEAKHIFYQKIIQDILDSLDNDTNIQTHIIDRIQANEDNERRNLLSLIGKMESKLTHIIFSSWNQILNKKITNTEVKLHVDKDQKGPYIEFNIKDDINTYRIIERSLGFRWFFAYILLTQFRTFRKDKDNVLFLFDEPAFNLHPSAQSELLKSFYKLPRVLYSTHSHYLINPKGLESTFVIKNEAIDYEKEELYDPKKTNIKIYKYREFASMFPSETSYFQPILDLLDYKPSNLDYIPNSVICEGKNDYYTYNYMISLLGENNYNINFIPCTSSSNMENLLSLFIGWGRDFFALLDSDNEGINQKKRYIEEYGIALEKNIFTYQDIDPNWTKIETEKLIAKEDQEKILKEYYPDNSVISKKLLNRSIQELSMNNITLNLSQGTCDNFIKVLEFIKSKFKS